jgi:hypothetical protein
MSVPQSAFTPRATRRIPCLEPGLALRFYPGVPADVHAALAAAAAFLRPRVRVPDPLLVTVVANSAIADREGLWTWGVFFAPGGEHERGDPVRIFLAAGAAERYTALTGAARTDALEELVGALFHEVMHYVQWRAGKPLLEEEAVEQAALHRLAYGARMAATDG